MYLIKLLIYTSRKDGKLKVNLDNDNTKTFRLIKKCDLQLYPDMEHISRNDSIRRTSVQSKTNTKTDSSRIENSHDDDRGITGFFKDGNQYKELHEDTVISFPFYEITFDILL